MNTDNEISLGASIFINAPDHPVDEIQLGWVNKEKFPILQDFDGLWDKLHKDVRLATGNQYNNHTATWYGPVNYGYTGIKHLKQRIPGKFRLLGTSIAKEMKYSDDYFNCILTNCYEDKGVSPHSDNEEIFKDYGDNSFGAVATISLGITTYVTFHTPRASVQNTVLKVKDGSIYVMPSGSFQHNYKHSVNNPTWCDYKMLMYQRRISLTFRHIPKHRINLGG